MLLRVALAGAIYSLMVLDVVPDDLAIVGVAIVIVFAIKAVIDWVRAADWEHDARVTREGNARARVRRAEARELSEAIREQKRLAKQRRQRSA